MNKAYLDRFISKYSLGDSVNSVVWNVNDEVLTTEFITWISLYLERLL